MAIKASNQISIVDVTDAYSVILTSEAYTFVGDIEGVGSGSSCETQAVAYCGTNLCSKVTVDVSAIECPTGISASVTNSGSDTVTIKFTTTAKISSSCEATIPVTVDGITINKKFSFAVAKAGAGVSKVKMYYLASSASEGIETTTSGWSETPATTTSTDKYLWSYQEITFSNGTTNTSTPVIIGTQGATGTGISSIINYYLTSSASEGVDRETTSGWSETPTPTDSTNKYLWCYQEITYTNKYKKYTDAVIVGTHGEAGADAIVLSITSSNGTVFKNSTGSTVLTAHVYVAGEEKDFDDETNGVVADSLGTIKWYEGTSTEAVAISKTLTVGAADVTNVAAYTCQLES